MKFLVIEFKICSLEYFMDIMTYGEADTLCKMVEYSDRNMWEGFRMVSYILALANSKNKIKPSDIISFKWDHDYQNSIKEEYTQDELNELKERTEKVRLMLFENTLGNQ